MGFIRRHPWVAAVVGYVIVGQIFGMLWPWTGWSLHVGGLLLLIAFVWAVGRFEDIQPRRRHRS